MPYVWFIGFRVTDSVTREDVVFTASLTLSSAGKCTVFEIANVQWQFCAKLKSWFAGVHESFWSNLLRSLMAWSPWSSWTFSLQSREALTHLCALPSSIESEPCTLFVDDSPLLNSLFTFFTVKNRISDRISQSAGWSHSIVFKAYRESVGMYASIFARRSIWDLTFRTTLVHKKIPFTVLN